MSVMTCLINLIQAGKKKNVIQITGSDKCFSHNEDSVGAMKTFRRTLVSLILNM